MRKYFYSENVSNNSMSTVRKLDKFMTSTWSCRSYGKPSDVIALHLTHLQTHTHCYQMFFFKIYLFLEDEFFALLG